MAGLSLAATVTLGLTGAPAGAYAATGGIGTAAATAAAVYLRRPR